MLHALFVALALVALACLPCVVALAITSADECVERAGRVVRRVLRESRHRLAGRPGLHWLVPAEPPRPAGPPIERLAADLRRLGRQRLGIATRSPVWFTAVQRAYDDRLCQACRSLDIEQYLGELEGLDLEIERVRVEGELIAAGVVLAPTDADRRQGGP